MSDSQRAKARSLVDPDVLTLGKMTQRTTKTTNPVEQANMSRQGAASPQPRLTPTSRPFKKGGAAKSSAGKMKKAAAVAGMLSALSQGAQGAPAGPPMGAAPPAAPAMAGPMGAPPGMKKGGRKMAMGGKPTDAEGDPMLGMKRGGATKAPMNGMRMHKAKGGGVAHVAMKGAANKKPDSGTGGNLVPRNKMARGGHAKPKEGSAAEERTESKRFESREDRGMKRGGKCMKCGGAAGAGHKCGGRMMKAMGGPAKQRRGVMDKAGKPTSPKRHSYEDSLI